MKTKCKNIFVVLTYINSDDLQDFVNSVKKNVEDYKVIVVNSFHDEESKKRIRDIAIENGCDFINVENKGYSFGNNRGIEYAFENYNFDFLTVSNADIVINRYNTAELPDGIFAGIIIARDGRQQNPMLVQENHLSEELIYKGFYSNKKSLLLLGLLINKINRMIFLSKYKKKINSDKLFYKKIFQAHGSFITFSFSSLKDMWNSNDMEMNGIFDENMFLFGEEGVLAKRAIRLNIPIYFSNYSICHHKEDGSMRLSKINLEGELKKNNIYFHKLYVENNTKRNKE